MCQVRVFHKWVRWKLWQICNCFSTYVSAFGFVGFILFFFLAFLIVFLQICTIFHIESHWYMIYDWYQLIYIDLYFTAWPCSRACSTLCFFQGFEFFSRGDLWLHTSECRRPPQRGEKSCRLGIWGADQQLHQGGVLQRKQRKMLSPILPGRQTGTCRNYHQTLEAGAVFFCVWSWVVQDLTRISFKKCPIFCLFKTA